MNDKRWIASRAGYRGGVLAGLGGGLIAGGAVRLGKLLRYQRDRTYRERVDLQQTDERYRYISLRSWAFAGRAITVVSALACILCMLLGRETESRALGLLCALAALSYVAAFAAISRKV